MTAYSSKLHIVIGGKTLRKNDPRLPDALRNIVSDEKTSGKWVGSTGNVSGLPRTDPERFRSLLENLIPLLRDLEVTNGILPDIEDRSWDGDPDVASAFIGKMDAGYQGIRVQLSASKGERLTDLAQQVQEWEIDALHATSSNVTWPHCPLHPNRHPLSPESRDGLASWCCPVTGDAFCGIGALNSQPH